MFSFENENDEAYQSGVALAVKLTEESDKKRSSMFSGFLPAEISDEAVGFLVKSSVYFEMWGGYPYSGLRMLGIDAEREAGERDVSMLKRDGTLGPELAFPISAVCVRALSRGERVAPRNLAQEVEQFRLQKGTTGDILVLDSELVLFACADSADFLKGALTTVGKMPVVLRLRSADDFAGFEPPEEQTTIASNRLDAAVGAIFRLSREDARLAVKNGMVYVNSNRVVKHTATVSISDIVLLEKRGRIRVRGLETTKKGRIRLCFSRYCLHSPSGEIDTGT
ncbi:hypothetical protein J7K50_00790 [bacterium]|nr:hypothetical protein [bacterium]